MADLVHDYRALDVARKDAELLVSSDAFWEDVEYEALREMLEKSGVLQGERID